MKLKQLFHEALCEKYLGQTIKSDFGDYFVVAEIEMEHGFYGDPPLEITFISKAYREAEKTYIDWQKTNNPEGKIPTPKEIDEPLREACRNGMCCLSNLDDDLPEL
jgi:hypothetical protein